MTEIEFDYEAFLAKFPHIAAAVTEEKLNETYITDTFNLVAEWLGPRFISSSNCINILYFATCHLLTLDLWGNGQTGRVASASQGSVSTSFDLLKTKSTVGDWWVQTPCGQRYWILTAGLAKGGRLYTPNHYHPYG